MVLDVLHKWKRIFCHKIFIKESRIISQRQTLVSEFAKSSQINPSFNHILSNNNQIY